MTTETAARPKKQRSELHLLRIKISNRKRQIRENDYRRTQLTQDLMQMEARAAQLAAVQSNDHRQDATAEGS